MLMNNNLIIKIYGNAISYKMPLNSRLNAFFIKIMLMCLVTCFTINLGNAKQQTNYGRIYNVQDYIDAAPTTGYTITQETIGFQRCLSTVMHSIYSYYFDTNQTHVEKTYTILIPKKLMPYEINDKLSAIKISNGGSKTYIWERPSGNAHIKVTINIIGLNINNSDLKDSMYSKLNQQNNTQINSSYDASFTTQIFFVANNNYGLNGIESNTNFDTLISQHLAQVNLVNSNNNPNSTNFLIYTANTNIPIIQSKHPIAHNFFDFTTRGIPGNGHDAYVIEPGVKKDNLNGTQDRLGNTELNICGIRLEGVNQTNNTAIYSPTSLQHNENFSMGIGLNISNFKNVYVDNMVVENIYGSGIVVNNRFFAYINGAVEVRKNVVKNVWGLKYKQVCNGNKISYDDTGDGIRFEGIDSGISNMNYIKNDVSYTKQYGRIGLATCSEHNRNTIADSNYIHGYDRGIHSENNLSGFKIRRNRVTGSETGIVFDGNRDYTSTHFCPQANSSEISNNYISNEGIDYNPYLQKIYPPHLFFASHAFRSNEYWGTEIKNNEFLIDKTHSNYNYPTANLTVITNTCIIMPIFLTNPKPYNSLLPLNNTAKYHFYSGIRAQQVTCNLFNTIHSNNTGYTIGGVILRSFCPNEINGVNTTCGLFFNNSVSLPSCSTNQLTTSSIPIEFKGNILINCNEINILHPNSSYATQGLYPNYFVNNDSTSITSNINIDHFIKAPILVPYNCNNWYNTPFLFANISAQKPSCANPINSGKIGLTSIGGSGNITYTINPTATQTNPGNFTNLPANTYTITATDANAVSISTVVEIISPLTGNFCACANGDTLVKTPNVILKTAPTATDFIAQYGSVISGKVFYIDSIFTIDASINFENCSFWFTSSGQIVLNGPYTLNLAKCKLQAACEWWQGIVTNTPQQKVIVQNNSLIKNADIGIEASNNAIVEISNSFFMDNHTAGLFLKDMTDSNYSGYVIGCRFEAPTVLPSLPNALKFGIALQDIVKMNIGDISNGSKGNTFTKLRLGIYYVGTAPIISNIGIYNNKFHQIKETYYTNAQFPEAYIINNTYTLGYGTAIYAYNFGSPMNHKLNLDVRNASPATSNLAFSQCDRGIVTVQSSLIAENLYLDSVTMGICNFSYAPNVSYSVNNNKLYHTYIGMQFAGEKLNSIVNHNIIESTLYPYGVLTGNSMGDTLIWPTGIDISYFSNTDSTSFIAENDSITIIQYAGLGVQMSNTGKGVKVKNNVIELSTEDGGQWVCGGSTNLAGVAAFNNNGSTINSNIVNGQTSGIVGANRVDAGGLLIDKCSNLKIGCNNINATRFGILGINKNNSDPGMEYHVKGNSVINADAGWVFRHLNEEGTFGNVGSTLNDNNNIFGSLNTSAKIFKYCLQLIPNDYIFTTTINPIIESLSENMNTLANDCWYEIQANPGASTFNLNDCAGLQLAPYTTDIKHEEAIAIATNTKTYVAFEELSHWYDSKRLFAYLRLNTTYRDSNDTLSTFYTLMEQSAIAQEVIADDLLQNLQNNFASLSPAQIDGTWIDLNAQNELINSSQNIELQDYNEYRINALYLKLMRYGIDSLMEDDKTFIQELAPKCPYIEGSAVYKARNLNKLMNPGMQYDNLKICNAVGVYKQYDSTKNNQGFSTIYNEELTLLTSLLPNKNNKSLNAFELYPNPTRDMVNIRYNVNDNCLLEIYDATSRKLKVIQMPAGTQKTTISVSELAPGSYTYKFIVGGVQKKCDKITIY